jgi:hypothetical protein
VNAGGLHVVLSHSCHRERAINNDRKRRAVCRMNGMKSLTIKNDGLDIGDIFQAKSPQIIRGEISA